MDGAVGDGRVPGNLANDVGHLSERYRIGVIEQRSAKDSGVGENVARVPAATALTMVAPSKNVRRS